MLLEIDLVPKTAWNTNLRSHLSKSEWDVVRRKCYKLANYKCEVCGGVGDKHPVECHEKWLYTDNRIKLVGLIALCPPCHLVAHIGRAEVIGKFTEAKHHLMSVNNITSNEADKIINTAFSVWESRNGVDWVLDVTYLQNYLT